MTYKNKKYGFSLVELIVVLSILSILTGMIFPRYIKLKIDVARLEMTTMLKHIHMLQTSYKDENGIYFSSRIVGFTHGAPGTSGSCSQSKNALGFLPTEPCKLRYLYFLASGTGNVPASQVAQAELWRASYSTPWGWGRGRGFDFSASYC